LDQLGLLTGLWAGRTDDDVVASAQAGDVVRLGRVALADV
jgi:hypothetical protein